MGVSLKTENEECAGKTSQIRGSEGGRRDFTGTGQQGLTWQVSPLPSARLTRSLKLDTVVWLLRCSVFRETPMASTIHFKNLNGYGLFSTAGRGVDRGRVNRKLIQWPGSDSAWISP
jgi:hypothetical protein